MKVKVENLKPNPFRRIDKYPINREKVEALKTSINETDFWDNILAREISMTEYGSNKVRFKYYEIAYGHHRLYALRELGVNEIDIPVKDLSDGKMIQIMANENLQDWQQSPAVINETVHAAKDYLDGELARCESWGDLNKTIKILFDTEHSFTQTKNHGVGQTTILKFLGGNWKQWMIQEALEILKPDSKVDRKAFEKFPTLTQARVFKETAKTLSVPKQEQRRIAKIISKEGTGKRDIPARMASLTADLRKKQEPAFKDPQRPRLDDVVREAINALRSFESQIRSITSKAGTDAILSLVRPELKAEFIRAWDRVVPKMGEILTANYFDNNQTKKLLGGSK